MPLSMQQVRLEALCFQIIHLSIYMLSCVRADGDISDWLAGGFVIFTIYRHSIWSILVVSWLNFRGLQFCCIVVAVWLESMFYQLLWVTAATFAVCLNSTDASSWRSPTLPDIFLIKLPQGKGGCIFYACSHSLCRLCTNRGCQLRL